MYVRIRVRHCIHLGFGGVREERARCPAFKAPEANARKRKIERVDDTDCTGHRQDDKHGAVASYVACMIHNLAFFRVVQQSDTAHEYMQDGFFFFGKNPPCNDTGIIRSVTVDYAGAKKQEKNIGVKKMVQGWL